MWVDRPRLRQLLDGGLGRGLTAVVAGPGSGKTLLLADWLDRLELPTAWISLGHEMSDPVAFWTAFAEGLTDCPLRPGPSLDDDFIEGLIDWLGRQTDPLVVVIDDIHQLDDESGAFARVVAAETPLRLVTAGHAAPPAPAVVTIGEADLAFTTDEISRLLGHEGLPTAPRLVEQVAAKTRGWSAGVRLVALHLSQRGATDADASLRALDDVSRSGPVADFLITELLDHLDEPTRELLHRCCVVDVVVPELAAALDDSLTADEAARRLEALVASQLLVTRAARAGFRLHPLLLDLLRHRAAARPELRATSLGRAADWLEADGQYLAALRCTLDAGDWASAARICLDGGASMFGSVQRGPLIAELGRIPRRVTLGDPALLTTMAALAHCRFDRVELAEDVQQATRAMSGRPAAPTTIAALTVLRADLATFSGDAEESHRRAEAAVDAVSALAPSHPGAWAAYEDVVEAKLAAAEIWTGRLDTAVTRLEGRDSILAFGHRAIALVFAGRADEALEISGQALAIGRELGWDHHDLTAPAWAAAALAAADVGRPEEAATALESLAPMLEPAERSRSRHGSAGVDPFVASVAELARALTEFTAPGPITPWPDALAWSAWISTQVALADDRPADALVLTEPWLLPRSPAAGSRPQVSPTIIARLAAADAWGRLMTGEPPKPPRPASDRSTPGGPALEDSTLDGQLCEAARLVVAGEPQAATDVVQGALDRFEARAWQRPWRWAAPYVEPVLTTLADSADPTAGLAHFVMHGLRAPRSGTLSSGLTARELQVLRLAPGRLTAAQMGAQLFLSSHTVRQHLKSIHRKLGVASRREAVERAVELGLLDPAEPGPAAGRPPSR